MTFPDGERGKRETQTQDQPVGIWLRKALKLSESDGFTDKKEELKELESVPGKILLPASGLTAVFLGR